MRKTNVFGIPIDVPDPQDIEKIRHNGGTHHYVVMRVADMDFTGTPPGLRARVYKQLCSKCSHSCFVDPLALLPLRGLKLVIICTRCVAKQQGIRHP